MEQLFLTDARRKVLKGDTDHLTAQSERNQKSRIRIRARLALDELIEVAEAEGIENETVFEPEKVHHLLSAIYLGGGGVDPYEPSEEYRNELYAELAGFFIRQSEHRK